MAQPTRKELKNAIRVLAAALTALTEGVERFALESKCGDLDPRRLLREPTALALQRLKETSGVLSPRRVRKRLSIVPADFADRRKA
jgi:hypothetical protein